MIEICNYNNIIIILLQIINIEYLKLFKAIYYTGTMQIQCMLYRNTVPALPERARLSISTTLL